MDEKDEPGLPDGWELMRAEERAERLRQVEQDAAGDLRLADLLVLQARAKD